MGGRWWRKHWARKDENLFYTVRNHLEQSRENKDIQQNGKYVQKRIMVTPVGTWSWLKSNRKVVMNVFEWFVLQNCKIPPTWIKNDSRLMTTIGPNLLLNRKWASNAACPSKGYSPWFPLQIWPKRIVEKEESLRGRTLVQWIITDVQGAKSGLKQRIIPTSRKGALFTLPNPCVDWVRGR